MSIYRAIAMTIAGSDSGGGAGIQADLKTFAALRVFGTSAIAAITVQNSLGVEGFHSLPSQLVYDQIRAILTDFPVGAAKTGMLSSPEIITAVSQAIKKFKLKQLVVDPVMIAQSGDSLIAEDAIHTMKTDLLPLATLVTPNIPEAENLSGIKINGIDQMIQAAHIISTLGPKAVLVKGGHLQNTETITDVLLHENQITKYEGKKIHTQNNHGTGCTLSAAITAELAAGCALPLAIERGRNYLRLALENSFKPGQGYGPTGHAVRPDWIDPF